MSEEKKITVKEFKMWLEGVEEMQTEDWIPDARQWARIREKIACISEGETPVQQPSPAHAGMGGSVQSGQVFQTPQLPARPAGPSMMPAAPRPTNLQLQGPFANPESPQMPVRTPNIDTQGKPYESSFA
jgi:hypothetical protein